MLPLAQGTSWQSPRMWHSYRLRAAAVDVDQLRGRLAAQRVALTLGCDLVAHAIIDRARWASASNARASPSGSPATRTSGSPANSGTLIWSPAARAAKIMPTDSVPSRQAANPNTCADAMSSHCA